MRIELEVYPQWKVILWRWVRVFIAGFLSTIVIDQLFTGSRDVLMAVMRGAIIGGISAVFKALREEFPENKIISKSIL